MTFTGWNIPLSVMACYYIACYHQSFYFFRHCSKSDLSGWRCTGRITIEASLVGLRRWLLMLTSVGSCEDGPAHLYTVSSLNRALAPSSSGRVASLSFPLLSLSSNLSLARSLPLSLSSFSLYLSSSLSIPDLTHWECHFESGLRDECSLCVWSFLARHCSNSLMQLR
jgi:hypothetical protein